VESTKCSGVNWRVGYCTYRRLVFCAIRTIFSDGSGGKKGVEKGVKKGSFLAI
jgi:hypothetical protein